MKCTSLLVATLWALACVTAGAARADTFGSVEPVVSASVLDIGPFEDHGLEIRAAFADRLFRCGIVDQVEAVLANERVTTTIDEHNTRVQVAAGGFAGSTNPTYAFTVIDHGPHAATHLDIQALTDSLGYVLSQDSAFLLDADDPASFDFPANYVVVNFPRTPSLERSAALFETVGRIDPALFETDTSGYTQFGRSYLSLQSDVPDAEFIAGYVQAARELGLEYTPLVGGQPALFQGGAAFPGNDWIAHPHGEDYLGRLPTRIHAALGRIRAFHLRFTRSALREIRRSAGDPRELLRSLHQLDCR